MKKLSNRTIERLAFHVTGGSPDMDDGLTKYRTGAKLVSLFNSFGFDDEYKYPISYGDPKFPSRSIYTKDRLGTLNENSNNLHKLKELIEQVFDPLEFEGSGKEPGPAIGDFNKYLARDGLRIDIVAGVGVRLSEIGGMTVDFNSVANSPPLAVDFVEEHRQKCERKLADADYSGAISSARSLCEQVLLGIMNQVDTGYEFKGNLPKLCKEIAKHLNMGVESHRGDVDILRIVQGLMSSVEGLAAVSNKAGDRHGRSVNLERHHAELAVNAAKTICSFVTAIYTLQSKKKNVA